MKEISAAVKNMLDSLPRMQRLSIELEEAFEKAGVNPKRRGETLSIQEFANLANCINEIL